MSMYSVYKIHSSNTFTHEISCADAMLSLVSKTCFTSAPSTTVLRVRRDVVDKNQLSQVAHPRVSAMRSQLASLPSCWEPSTKLFLECPRRSPLHELSAQRQYLGPLNREYQEASDLRQCFLERQVTCACATQKQCRRHSKQTPRLPSWTGVAFYDWSRMLCLFSGPETLPHGFNRVHGLDTGTTIGCVSPLF